MLNRIFILVSILIITLNSFEIPIKHIKKIVFNKTVKIDGEIIQLTNSSQKVMSMIDGHIKKYFIRNGETIKKGQKLVLIESIQLSKMSAEYLSLKKQLQSKNSDINNLRKLYKNGMSSLIDLNKGIREKDAISARLNTVTSQLKSLNININRLNKTISEFIIYAHQSGVISEIFQPLHSTIKTETAIVSIVQSKNYYLKSYLPLKYGNEIKIGNKIEIIINNKKVISTVTKILPNIDRASQRIIILSSLDNEVKNLYINSFVDATLYLNNNKEYMAIEKSALSLINNEWVIFIEKVHNEEEHHIDEEDEDDEHNEHNKMEFPYEVRVVDIITENSKYFAISGVEVGEEYVSDKVYFVKSLLLKSALTGHGH